MMKVYDMVTYSLCAPAGDAPDQDTTGTQYAGLPTNTELGLQLHEAMPERREPELHPALRHTDVDSFLAAIDR